MNLTEYQKQSRITAIYKYKDDNVCYPALGVIGEFAEFAEARDACFDNLNSDDTTWKVCRDNLIKEAGDVFWYSASVATEAEIDLDEAYWEADPDQEFNIKVFCESCKKYFRDNNMEKRELIADELGKIMLYIVMTCDILLEEDEEILPIILQTNLDKLFSRKERGVLTGDGDNR